MITLDLSLHTNHKSPGFWKLDTFLLTANQVILNLIKPVIIQDPSACAHSKYFMVMRKLSRMKGGVELLSRALRTVDFEATVRPVYNGSVYSGHPVYYGLRTTSQKISTQQIVFTVTQQKIKLETVQWKKPRK